MDEDKCARFGCSVAATFLLLCVYGNSGANIRHDDICGNYNGRRLYLELGIRGIITAQNVTAASHEKFSGTSMSQYINATSHEQCSLELVTCPGCIITVTFLHLNLSHHCSGANVVMDSPCRCDYVWISEPPYEDVSGTPFCGLHSMLMMRDGPGPLTYRSQTRSLSLVLLYSESHSNAFSLEYSSERNRQFLKGYPGDGASLVFQGNASQGGVLRSPFFPAQYPRDLGVEYIITCQPDLSVNCRVRVLFQDFQLALSSIMEFYDWNGQRLDVSSGSVFRPPVILTTGPSLMIRFYANGGTDLGYKAIYSFINGNLLEKNIKPVTDCGGDVENLGGAITMMNMVTGGIKTYDCVWLIHPPKNYLHLKTHLYLKVSTFIDMAGNTELQVVRGLTSEQPVLETLRHPVSQVQPPRQKEHIVPVETGFYVSLRGTFSPTSRLAIVYTSFSYRDCFTGSDTLCQNHRCIPSQLYCDGFDHCGDNSDEPASCYKDWKAEPHDRHWYSHTPNYFFPKMERYPDLKTASLIFIISSFGLIFLIAALIILLYRMGARARQQRELQSRLQTISDLLDGAHVEDALPDDPPVYEAPPDYDDVIKIFAEPSVNQHLKRKRPNYHDSLHPNRANPEDQQDSAGGSQFDSSINTTSTGDMSMPYTLDSSACRYLSDSSQGLLLLPESNSQHLTFPSITHRSCQTTPIPDSPPPPYTSVGNTVDVDNPDSTFTSSLPNSDLPSQTSMEPTTVCKNGRWMNKKGKWNCQSWLLISEEDSSSHLSDIVSTPVEELDRTGGNNNIQPMANVNEIPSGTCTCSLIDCDNITQGNLTYMFTETNSDILGSVCNDKQRQVVEAELKQQLNRQQNKIRKMCNGILIVKDTHNQMSASTISQQEMTERDAIDGNDNHSIRDVTEATSHFEATHQLGMCGQHSMNNNALQQVPFDSTFNKSSDINVFISLENKNYGEGEPEYDLCSCEGACGCATARGTIMDDIIRQNALSLSAGMSITPPPSSINRFYAPETC